MNQAASVLSLFEGVGYRHVLITGKLSSANSLVVELGVESGRPLMYSRKRRILKQEEEWEESRVMVTITVEGGLASIRCQDKPVHACYDTCSAG